MQLLSAILVAAVLLCSCKGEEIKGGSGDDTLVGTDNSDTIKGNGGNDAISGKKRGDFLLGGKGNDLVKGSLGSDYVFGGSGNDVLRGGGSFDILVGESGNDVLYGEKGVDLLYGGSGADVLHGGPGAEYLVGSVGDDKLYADTGVTSGYSSYFSDDDIGGVVFPGTGADLIVLGPAGEAKDIIKYFGDEIEADKLAGAAADIIQRFDRTMDSVIVNLFGTKLTTSMIIGKGEYLVLKQGSVSYNFAQMVGQNTTALFKYGRIKVKGG